MFKSVSSIYCPSHIGSRTTYRILYITDLIPPIITAPHRKYGARWCFHMRVSFCSPSLKYAPPARSMHPQDGCTTKRETVNRRPVRIQLECIIVAYFLSFRHAQYIYLFYIGGQPCLPKNTDNVLNFKHECNPVWWVAPASVVATRWLAGWTCLPLISGVTTHPFITTPFRTLPFTTHTL